MTVLVTGATGNVGRLVVEGLVAEGAEVRALSRAPERAARLLPAGVRTVDGDLGRPGTLDAALKGVEQLFLFPVARTAREVVARAREAGVRRIVVLSSGAVSAGLDTTHHLPVERAVEESGLEWTHVRPGEFARNKLHMWGPSIRAEGVVRSAFPDALGVPVHEADIAEVAAAALLEDGHTGRAYSLSGPERLSHREQAGALADGLGRRLRFEPLTYGQARAAYIASGIPADIAEYLLGYQAEYAEEPPQVLPDTERVLGRPGRTLARWAADHAAELPDETAGAHAV